MIVRPRLKTRLGGAEAAGDGLRGGAALRGLAATLALFATACFASTQPNDERDPDTETGARAVETPEDSALGMKAGAGTDEPSSTPASAVGDAEPGRPDQDCPALEELPPIVGEGGGPFTLCTDVSECPGEGQGCYVQGGVGFCQDGDANDGSPCGESEVRLQAREPRPVQWTEGICMWRAWRDYLCCNWPDHFECDQTEVDAQQDTPRDSECIVVGESEQATDLSPTDACTLELECPFGAFVVECDGENDGTQTSGCTCVGDSGQVVSGLYEGEGLPACRSAARACTSASAR